MQFDHGYIARGYRAKKAGQPIDKGQVVRAANGRFYRIDEPRSFQTLSNARCPTFGNCNSYYRSGPLNMWCSYCNDACKGFEFVHIVHPQLRNQKRIIDAEYFVHLMGVGNDHQVALADRRYTWIRDNDQRLTSDHITMLVPRRNRDAVISLLNDPDE